MEVVLMIMVDTSKITITTLPIISLLFCFSTILYFLHTLSSSSPIHSSSVKFTARIFFTKMQNSHSFIAQKNRGLIEIDILKSQTLRFHEVSRVVSSRAAEPRRDREEEDEEETIMFDRSEADLKVDDDDEGFRTPTRTENKIPEPKQCPPPPRKPNLVFSSTKRKSRTFVKLDFSEDVGSMFPSVINSDFDRKVKKAKKNGDRPSVHSADRS